MSLELLVLELSKQKKWKNNFSLDFIDKMKVHAIGTQFRKFVPVWIKKKCIAWGHFVGF